MESSIKISLNSIIHNQTITLPANFDQLKTTYKRIFNLNDKQISKIKIFYMKQEKEEKVKIYLENDKEYSDFYLEEHPDLIQAELSEEDIGIIKNNNVTPNMPDIDNNNCLRCLEKNCYLIPLIKLNKDKDNNFMINYNCRNNHKGENIPITSYKSLLEKKLEDLLCSFCSLNTEKDKNIRLYYCYKCKKYICNLEKCNNDHEKQCDNNDLIQLKKIDSYCILHGNNLIYYCEDCKISFCSLCKNHQDHKKTIIDEMTIKDDDKKLIIESIEKNLNELEIIYSNIKNQLINKLSNIYEMNKNLLLLNKKIIENLDKKEMNGEIYVNVNNCKYIKEIKIKDDLEYLNNIFKQIEDYFSNEFFEFDEEKQKNKLLSWKEIPVVISYDKIKEGYFTTKKKTITKNMLLSPDMTIGQFHCLVRKNMDIKDEDFYILANRKVVLQLNLTLKEIYDKYKRDDYILYLEAIRGERFG
jgi:hypothetical protein